MIRTLAQCMSFIYTIKSKSLEGRGYYENIIELQWNQCSSTGYKLLLEICVLTLFYPNFIIHLSIGITNWSYVYKATLQYVRYTFSYLRSSRYFKVLVPNLPWRSFMAWKFFFYHWNLQKFIITWEVKLVILDLYYRTQFHLGILVLLYLYNIYKELLRMLPGSEPPKLC